MLSLRKRIKELQENTSSLEAQSVCKEILENFVNLPESQISAAIVEKLKTVSDSDKHVEKFVKITEKINAVNDLGVARGIAKLKESQIYSYPGLRYGLSKIESSLMYKQVRVLESDSKEDKEFKPGDTWTGLNMKSSTFKIEEQNVQGMPEYMLIDQTLECLKTFVWDKEVESVYSNLKNTRETLREDIDVAISLFGMKNAKGSFFFDSVIPKLEEHFINPTETSRTSLIEDLRKLNFYAAAKSLSESLSKIQSEKTGGVQIISDNSKCTVSSIYSPVLLENGAEHFFVKGDFYKKENGKISKITEGVESLPEKFREVCRIISSPNVFIKEGKVSFYLKRDKVEILENENKVEVRFNGNKVSSSELAKNMVSAGMFRLEESKVAYDVQSIAESFSNIYDLDFGKIIESTLYPGCYVVLMKDGNSIYLNKVNESQRSNEFFSGLNAVQARNKVLEFIGFDIKESMEEYLERDEAALRDLKENQRDIIKSLSIVEANLEKVNNSLQDPHLSNNAKLLELKSMLEGEMRKLKNTHRSLSDEIRAFESREADDSGFSVGDEVKLKETGESATVSSINSSRDTVNIVTSSGKSIEVPVSEISSLEEEIKVAEKENEEAAENAEDEMDSKASHEEHEEHEEEKEEDKKKA